MKLISDPGLLKFFPDTSDVFQGDLEMHSKYFFPLLTFDASIVDPSIEHPLHFVAPAESPEDGVGGLDNMFHAGYCMNNWIGFDVGRGKYCFQANEQFFHEARIAKDPDFLKGKFPNHPPYEEEYPVSLREGLAEARENYIAFKEAYLAGDQKERFEGWREHMHLGSVPHDANWAHCSMMEVESTNVELSVEDQIARWGGTAEDCRPTVSVNYPLTKDGRRFLYLGSIEATLFDYQFMDWDTILLFYDPVSKVALSTFDCT